MRRLVVVALLASLGTASAEPCKCTVVDPGESQKHVALWTAAGGGTLLLSSLALSLYEKHQYDAAVGTDQFLTAEQVDKANHAHDITKVWGTGLFVAGAAAMGAAAIIWMTAPDREVIVAPTATSDQVGLAAVGRF